MWGEGKVPPVTFWVPTRTAPCGKSRSNTRPTLSSLKVEYTHCVYKNCQEKKPSFLIPTNLTRKTRNLSFSTDKRNWFRAFSPEISTCEHNQVQVHPSVYKTEANIHFYLQQISCSWENTSARHCVVSKKVCSTSSFRPESVNMLCF